MGLSIFIMTALVISIPFDCIVPLDMSIRNNINFYHKLH